MSSPIHTKALIIDEEFMLIGSHNWLLEQEIINLELMK
jgi:hypothetical protein